MFVGIKIYREFYHGIIYITHEGRHARTTIIIYDNRIQKRVKLLIINLFLT